MKTNLGLSLALICIVGMSQTSVLGANKASGKATIYSKSFQGKRTTSGEKYNANQVSGASNKFPLGSKVLVKNQKTGKQLVVKINDRTAKMRFFAF